MGFDCKVQDHCFSVYYTPGVFPVTGTSILVFYHLKFNF